MLNGDIVVVFFSRPYVFWSFCWPWNAWWVVVLFIVLVMYKSFEFIQRLYASVLSEIGLILVGI